MKLSRGFAELIPSIAVPVFYVLSAAAVILALKRLDLSVTYAIWSGVGTALAAMIGIAYFREPVSLLKLASLMLVVVRRGRPHLGEQADALTARAFPAKLRGWTVLLARATV